MTLTEQGRSEDQAIMDGTPESTTTASQQVLATNELMEMIFSFLPLPSLLRIQTVNSQWNALIRGSSILQQKLFFKPVIRDTVWLVEIANLPAQFRPLPRNFRSKLRVMAEVPRKSKILKNFHRLLAIPVTVNPLFLRPDPLLDGRDSVDEKADHAFVAQYTVEQDLLSNIRNHSMRDMLPTQPPVTNLCLEILVRRRPGEPETGGMVFRRSRNYGLYSAKIQEPDGITMGHVASVLQGMSMLGREGDIKMFMNGVVEASEEDAQIVKARTNEWRSAVGEM